jgi:hypothetical protein
MYKAEVSEILAHYVILKNVVFTNYPYTKGAYSHSISLPIDYGKLFYNTQDFYNDIAVGDIVESPSGRMWSKCE